MPGRDWFFTVTGANGGSVLATVPWRTARVGWVLDSPGSIEVDLLPDDVSDDWTPGDHRVQANTTADGVWQNCYLTHLSQFGPPDDVRFRAAGLGLESIFDWRIVHHEWAARQTVPEHLETLLDDLQVQQDPGGDMGFDPSVVVATGTFSNEPLRSYCLGVVAADVIRELANLGNGFDWEIDVQVDPPALTLYKPQRGVTTPAFSIAPENCQGWTVEFDTSDLLTTVTAIGEKSDPWGPRHNLARTGLGDVYGRHEIVIDVDAPGDDAAEVRAELYDAAYEELQKRAGARLQVRAMFIDGHPDAPWTLGDVWLGDSVTLDLPSYFGGSLEGRCTEFSVSLQPAGLLAGNDEPGIEVLEYVFDTLVEDITEGASSS